MKNKVKNKRNIFKKAFYRGRATNFRKLISLMLVFGILASGAYFCKYAYVEYAVSRAHVILNYPEIAESKYPDGSRFTYYDFICEENLEAALKLMQKEDKYEHFTVDDIRDKFYIYSYLDSPAGASVSSARSEGNDFTYVANEYKITFVQPHDYKEKIILKILLGKDLSGEFLEKLIEVNRQKIAEELGGINAFKLITDTVKVGDYDYSEEVNIYKTKINNVIAYLKYLEKQRPDFVSKKHNLSLSDIKGKYSFLITNSLDGINNFVESSGLSKDVSLASNKINVNIENNRLKYNKEGSRAHINSFAMHNYDQTFTENLINVIQNKDYGLYQARPKTAFDTVSALKHSADESVAEYETKINIFSKELAIYQNVMTTPEEHERLISKCDKLISDFEKEYTKLTETAREVVTEYYNNVNENYITSKITHRGLISKSLIMKMGIAFALGAMFAFVVAVFITAVNDSRKVRRKRKLINSIKKNSEGEGA